MVGLHLRICIMVLVSTIVTSGSFKEQVKACGVVGEKDKRFWVNG